MVFVTIKKDTPDGGLSLNERRVNRNGLSVDHFPDRVAALAKFWSEDPPWSDEETDNPLRADDCNFYKLEKWTKDGTKIERMLYTGNNLDKARDLFAEAVKHRPRIRLTIRQRTRVLEQWPPS
jgi:hypothetical protein